MPHTWHFYFAGKEVYTSNFDPADLELIIDFIEQYLNEPVLTSPKVQKSSMSAFKDLEYGNQGISPKTISKVIK